jgi:hypothetical protein
MISNPDHSKIAPILKLDPKFKKRFSITTTPFYYFWFAVMHPSNEPKLNPNFDLDSKEIPENLPEIPKDPPEIPEDTSKNISESTSLIQNSKNTPFLEPPSALKWSTPTGQVKQIQNQNQHVIKQEEFRIIARLELPKTPESKKIYQRMGISNQIPLLTEFIVTTQKTKSYRYHLAIDGSDMRHNLGNYHFAGLRLINTISAKNRGKSVSPMPVFWQFFIPFLDTILWERTLDRYPDAIPPLYQRIINQIKQSIHILLR